MADLIDEFNRLKVLVAKATATGDTALLHRKIHIIDHEAERERKLNNPQKSTRVIFNCRTAGQYKEFQAAKEPFFEIAGDPHIAVDCIIRALSAFSADTIREWVKGGHEPGPAPPKAELPNIPDWLKESGA
jgi:hypothetical protein